jgi:hypothetical protein
LYLRAERALEGYGGRGDHDHRNGVRTEGKAMIPIVNSLWEQARLSATDATASELADMPDVIDIDWLNAA